MKSIQATRLVLITEIISFFLQYTFGLSRNYSDIFDAITFCISLALVINVRFDSGDKWKKKCIGWIVFFVAISSMVNINTFGFGSILTIGRFLLYSLLVNKIYISSRIRNFIVILVIIQACLLQIVDTSSYNTNTIGLVYLTVGIVWALFYRPKYFLAKIFYWVILCIFGYCIYLSETRSCMVAYLFFLIMCILPPIFYDKKYVLLVGSLLLTVGSLLYVYLYVYMWQQSVVDADVVSLIVEDTGKDLFSGRQRIWEECLGLINENFFWGTGSKITLRSFYIVNIHNSILNFFVVYGSIVGFLIIYMICRIICEYRIYAHDKRIHDCISAYFSILIVSIFETNLLVFAFISFIPLFQAHSIIQNKKLNNLNID